MSHIQTASVARKNRSNSPFLHHDITLEEDEEGFDLWFTTLCWMCIYITDRCPKEQLKFQNEAVPVMLFLPVKAVQHVAWVVTYSVGRRSAVLPRRKMTGPRGLRIFLMSALLSSENRLTRLKPKANRTFRNNAGRMTRWRSGSAVYR